MISLKCCTFHLPKSSDSLIQSLCSIFKAKYYLPKPKVFQREKIPWQTKQMVVYRSSFYLVLQVTWLRGKVQCIWPTVCFHTSLFSWTLLTNTCFMSLASFWSTVSQFRRLEAIELSLCCKCVPLEACVRTLFHLLCLNHYCEHNPDQRNAWKLLSSNRSCSVPLQTGPCPS